MLRRFNQRFHESRLFRFANIMLIWVIGLFIVKPYFINPWGMVIFGVVWFALESFMYGWEGEIDLDI